MTADFGERGAVAAIVAARPAKSDGAAVKDLADDDCDFANAVILRVVANIEDLIVYRLTRRLQSEDHRLADVLDVNQRPPWRSIARHADLSGGPREPG